jgi:hypothetical protein
MRTITILAFILFTLTGCAPKVGSPEWCEKMSATPKGDWTANDTGEYAKSCILGLRKE